MHYYIDLKVDNKTIGEMFVERDESAESFDEWRRIDHVVGDWCLEHGIDYSDVSWAPMKVPFSLRELWDIEKELDRLSNVSLNSFPLSGAFNVNMMILCRRIRSLRQNLLKEMKKNG